MTIAEAISIRKRLICAMLTDPEIRRDFGVYWVPSGRKPGRPHGRVGPMRSTLAKAKWAARLRDYWSISQIAASFGVHKNTVRYWFKILGVENE